ncbi:soluble guanylate cyclase gcy-33-like [Mizuhopecten yessoensis]|uniref:soluble guanylate cyclase gcy-33-like n=1 Tax=Mizuhopecten yessoensis TaxID=6573 RepID=UPI000B4597BE|nr:soluble guanylate cyclase gcy-33-like [Mizuhopecten yessoensis]
MVLGKPKFQQFCSQASSATDKVSSILSFGSTSTDMHLQTKTTGICRHGILTDAGKKYQLTRMLCLTIFPIVLLWSFTAFTLTESINEKSTAEQNMQQLQFTTELGQVIHHLQRERDMSVLYLSALGPETRTFLLDEYIETDDALAALTSWPDEATRSGWQDPTVTRDTFATVWRDLIAYTKITIGKQDVGVERALGTYFFVKGGFNNQDAFELYNRRVHKFRAFYYTAHMYSSMVDNLYKEGFFSASYNVTETINKYRFEIQNSEEYKQSPSVLKAQKWFDNMTIYMDALLGIQVKLGSDIISQINEKLTGITESIAVSISCLVIVLCVCPLVVVSTKALTSSIQNYAVILVHKTKELTKEKKRTDSLLYQMIPKSIADKLKKNVHIDAEYFKSATVFFIDIFDFNRLVMESSPIEIVDLLNAVYKNIDEHLDNFDVYKVETINDCYMVSSGLPKRNRDRHVIEIANLALVLRAMVLAKPFVLSGDREIKLRFGMNTANSIHVSQPSYSRLMKYGYYIMKKRGSIFIKGKGEMVTYWLMGKQSESCQVMDVDVESANELDEAVTYNAMPGELTQYDQRHLTSALTVPLPGRVYSRKHVHSKCGKVSPQIKGIQEHKDTEVECLSQKNQTYTSTMDEPSDEGNDGCQRRKPVRQQSGVSVEQKEAENKDEPLPTTLVSEYIDEPLPTSLGSENKGSQISIQMEEVDKDETQVQQIDVLHVNKSESRNESVSEETLKISNESTSDVDNGAKDISL